MDNECYIRDWGQGLMAGGFVTPGKPVFTKGIPYPAEFTSLPEDWDAFRKQQFSSILKIWYLKYT